MKHTILFGLMLLIAVASASALTLTQTQFKNYDIENATYGVIFSPEAKGWVYDAENKQWTNKMEYNFWKELPDKSWKTERKIHEATIGLDWLFTLANRYDVIWAKKWANAKAKQSHIDFAEAERTRLMKRQAELKATTQSINLVGSDTGMWN